MPRRYTGRPSAHDEFERVSEFDDFEMALTKIVKKDRLSAGILRQVAETLPDLVNSNFELSTGNAVLLLADKLGLTATRVRRLYTEFAEEDIWRMTALLMAARRSILTKEDMRAVFNHKPAAAELKSRLPAIYFAMQEFIHVDCVNEFIGRTSAPPEPGSLRANVVKFPKPSGS